MDTDLNDTLRVLATEPQPELGAFAAPLAALSDVDKEGVTDE